MPPLTVTKKQVVPVGAPVGQDPDKGTTENGVAATIVTVAVFDAPAESDVVRVIVPGHAFAAIVAVTAEPVHEPLLTVVLYTLVGSEDVVV